MIRHRHLEQRFVQYIPEKLEAGVLYISMEYATAAHACCCGCGQEVVTPFTPTDWNMTFDGETVSLSPSIGNWNMPCRSHYVIERSQVIEARPWTDEQVTAEHRRDKKAKASYYGTEVQGSADQSAPASLSTDIEAIGLWARIKKWVSRISH